MGDEDGHKGLRRRLGDPPVGDLLARMIRVDHAGEFGAVRIYQGQMAVLGSRTVASTLKQMEAKEQEHLQVFGRLLVERRVRPSVLQPLWGALGYALGAGTALMGEGAAMACTVAVEEVIEEHYLNQAERLGDSEVDLKATIEKFRDDEMEHREIALEHGGTRHPAYPVLGMAIKTGSRLAIWLAARL
ncbi:MAG: demethoxyubiquinone hydroxylase family protein [Alphaproteobacteria bacterium]|nr:demethoxyubiquinone hydroxylase family protein [Alphaproteobacteria bacterium]